MKFVGSEAIGRKEDCWHLYFSGRRDANSRKQREIRIQNMNIDIRRNCHFTRRDRLSPPRASAPLYKPGGAPDDTARRFIYFALKKKEGNQGRGFRAQYPNSLYEEWWKQAADFSGANENGKLLSGLAPLPPLPTPDPVN